MVKIGDRLVVCGLPYPAFVEKVWYDSETARTVIELDWKEHGKSKVFDHDENNLWYKYDETN